jgi:lysophospholipase L1-like esterase
VGGDPLASRDDGEVWMIDDKSRADGAQGRGVRAVVQRLILVAASALLTLVVLELVGRLVILPMLLAYSSNEALKQQLAHPRDLGVVSLYIPHHYYLYVTRPGYRSADGALRHDSRGCRAEETAVPKPPAVYRIVALGGSTVYGTGVRQNEETFAYRLETMLNRWAAEGRSVRRLEVINCGVPAYTSAETLARYMFSTSEYQADLLIIQHGLNDVLPRSLPTVSRDYREFSKTWDHTMPESHGWFLLGLLRAARTRFGDSVWTQGIGVIVRRPYWNPAVSGASPVNFRKHPPSVFESNTRRLLRLAASDGAAALLMTEHVVTDPQDRPPDWLIPGGIQAVIEHNGVITALAREAGTLFLDLQTALRPSDAILPDGRHLNEEGERRKAEAIFQYLQAQHAAGRWRL